MSTPLVTSSALLAKLIRFRGTISRQTEITPRQSRKTPPTMKKNTPPFSASTTPALTMALGLLLGLLGLCSIGTVNAAQTNDTNTGLAAGITNWDTSSTGWATANTWDSVNGSNSIAIFTNAAGTTAYSLNITNTGIYIGGLTINNATNAGQNNTTITLGGGTITLAAANTTFNLGNTTNSTLTNTTKLVISSVLAGSGALTLTRTIAAQVSGTQGAIFSLQTNNTYSGGTTLAGNIWVNFYSGGAFGSNGTTVNMSGGSTTINNASGGALTLSNYNWTWNYGGVISGGNLDFGTGTVNLGTASNGNTMTIGNVTTVNGNITSAAGASLTKSGTGTLILGGSNNISGGVFVNNGYLNLNNSNALAGVTNFTWQNGGGLGNSSGSNITLANNIAQTWGSFSANQLNYNGANDLNLGAGSVTLYTNDVKLNVTSTGALIVGGKISGPYAVNFTKMGSGNLILSGSNSYTGTNLITGGVLEFQNANALFGGNTAAWVGASNVVSSGATMAFGVGTFTGAFTSNQVSTLLANLNTNGASTGFKSGSYFGLDASGASFTLTNNVSNGIGFNAIGTGTITLAGSNSYTGGNIVSGGTLVVGSSNALGAAATLTMANGTTLSNSYSLGLTTVTLGNATIAGSGTFTQGGGITATNTGALSIANSIGGSGGFTQSGTGTTTLSVSNSYTGNTIVNAGGLTINGSGALSASTLAINAGTVTVTGANTTNSGGGALSLKATTGLAQLVVTNGATMISTNFTIGNASGTGTNIVRVGTGSTLNYTSGTMIMGNVASNNNLLSIDGGTFSNSTYLAVGYQGVNQVNTLSNNGGTISLATMYIGRAASSASNSINQYVQSSGVLTGADFRFANSGANASYSTNIIQLTGGTATLNNQIGYNQTGTNIMNQIVLGGGTTTLSGGIAFGAASNTGVSGITNQLYLNSGATLILNTITTNAQAGVTANQVFLNGGTLKASANNSTLITSSGISVTLSNNSTIDTATFNTTIGAVMDGSGGITVNGAGGTGTLTLGGANSYTGATTVNGGRLVAANNSALGSTNNTLTVNAGTLYINTGIVVTNAAVTLNAGTINNGSIAFNSLTASNNGSTYAYIGSTMTGSGSLVKMGTGTLTFFGNTGNSYSGGTFINSGVISVAGSSSNNLGASTGNLTVAGGASLAYATNANITVANASFGSASGTANLTANGVNSGGGTLTVNNAIAITNNFFQHGLISLAGTGTLTMNGGASSFANLWASNSYSGGTVINGGTLYAQNGYALGGLAGTVTLNSGNLGFATNSTNYIGTLNLAGGNAKGAGFVWLPSAKVNFTTLNSTLTNDWVGVYSSLDGNGTINQNGAGGQLLLSVSNSFTGTVNISAGAVRLSDLNSLNSSSTVNLLGGNLDVYTNNTIGALNIASGYVNQNGAPTLTASSVTATNNGYAQINASLAGNFGINKSSGTNTLYLANSNSFGGTGYTNILVAGTLSLGNAYGLGSAANALDVRGGTLYVGALNVTAGGVSLGNGSITGTGTLTSDTYALNGGAVSANLGGGTINVGGNTYLGGTAAATTVNVNSGSLTSGAANRLASGATAAVSGGATLNLGGYDQTLAGLTGSGLVTNAANKLTLNIASGNNDFGGSLRGAGSLAKNGNGTLTLSGANTYSGVSTVNGGTLNVNGTSTASAITVNNTGTLGGSGSVGAVTIASGGTLSPGNSPGTLTVTSMIWNGGANYNWQIADATGVAGTGYDTISGTSLNLSNLSAGNTFNIRLWSIASASATNGEAANFNNTNSYSWTLGTFGAITGFDSSYFTINTSATNGTGGFANATDPTGVWSVTTNGGSLLLNYTYTYVPPASDTLTNGGGLLLITDSKDYTGGIDLNAGTTVITSTGSVTATNTDYSFVGNTGSDVTLVVSNGTLNVNGLVAGYNPDANNNTIVVDGSSAVATVGANGIILGYDVNTGNSLIVTNGGTVTSAGQVVVGSATSSGGGQNQIVISGAGSSLTAQGLLTVADSSDSNSVTVQNGGTLASAGGAVISVSESSSYAGAGNSVLVTGAGSLWTNTGDLTIGNTGGGAVTVAGGATLVSDTITIANQTGSTGVLNVGTLGGFDTGVTVTTPAIYFGSGSGALNLNQADTMTLGSVLVGNGALNQNGSGTSVLTGNSSAFTGTTTISGGTLQVGASNAAFFDNGLGSGAIVNNGTLAFRQYNSIVMSNALSGNGTLLQDSYSATTTLAGANTSTGAVIVNSGTLQIGNGGTSGSLGSGGVTLANYNSLLTFNRSDDITVANDISGLGGISQIGFGKLTLSGANSFQNVNTIDNGSVAITGSLAGGNGRFYVGNTTSGAALSIGNGASVTLGTVDVGETSSANNNTLTVNGGTLSLAGSLSVGAATNGNSGNTLVINNSGTVSSGNLYVGVAGGASAGNNSVSVSGTGSSLTANGGTVGNFIGANSSSNSLTVSGGASFTALGNTYIGAAGGVANVATVTGAGSIWSNSGTIYAGQNGGGTLNISSGASVTASGGLTIAANAGSTGTVNVGSAGGSDTGVTLNASGISMGAGNAALNFNQADTTTIAAPISGTGGTVSQAGTGKTILTGASSFSGTTAITRGTLQVGNGLGTATLGKTSIQNGGVLAFNNAGTSVFAGTISGTGSFSQNGGTTVLSGVNTFTGDTAITAGTLQVGTGGQLGNGNYAGAIANSGSLSYTSDLNQTLSGIISGSGLVTKSSASTLTLAGANTYNGSTTVNGGTLSLGTTGSLASKALAVTGGSTLLLGNNNQLASDATLNLAGQLNLGGGATHSSQTFASLTLTGNSSIDFGALSGTSSLTFGSLVMNNYALNVFNWTGKPLWGPDSSGAGGADAFTSLFVNSTISSADLSKINFYSGSTIDSSFLGAGSQQAGGLIVPVPEPGVVLSALMLVGWLIFGQRAKLARMLARRGTVTA